MLPQPAAAAPDGAAGHRGNDAAPGARAAVDPIPEPRSSEAALTANAQTHILEAAAQRMQLRGGSASAPAGAIADAGSGGDAARVQGGGSAVSLPEQQLASLAHDAFAEQQAMSSLLKNHKHGEEGRHHQMLADGQARCRNCQLIGSFLEQRMPSRRRCSCGQTNFQTNPQICRHTQRFYPLQAMPCGCLSSHTCGSTAATAAEHTALVSQSDHFVHASTSTCTCRRRGCAAV